MECEIEYEDSDPVFSPQNFRAPKGERVAEAVAFNAVRVRDRSDVSFLMLDVELCVTASDVPQWHQREKPFESAENASYALLA